ncbi:MAG: hypothetical protein DMG65_07775 [Candidatus Angelobacter sp. Gp1-AA117]|nr:MAG: hypothetical protein DMG65_07775 [Candidatus Angelobacter sp. Gp1-AA117]
MLSARWIDDDGLQAVIPTITASIQKQLSKANASKIDLVSVLPTTHPLVKDLMYLDIATGKAYEVQASALMVRGLFDVIVFAAQKPHSVGNIQRQKIRTSAGGAKEVSPARKGWEYRHKQNIERRRRDTDT